MFKILHTSKKLAAGLITSLCLLTATMYQAGAQISLTTSSLSYTQNFDGIDGTAATIPSALSGWTISPNTLKGQDCGTSNSGGIYAYGAAGSGEYALGYLPAASSPNDTFYAIAHFVNNTGGSIESVTISYNFERWRTGARINGFSVTSDLGDVSALNHTGPGASGANCTVITTAKSVTLSGLSVPNGDTFYVAFGGNRGTGTGASQGVAIDDFSLTATIAGAPTLTADTLSAFGSVCNGDTSATQSLTVNGSSLSGPVTVTAPAGFLLSQTVSGPFSSSLLLTPVSGSLSSTVYVIFAPASSMPYTGHITFSGAGMAPVQVSVSGIGNQVMPSIVITLDHDLNICEGAILTFSSAITGGGSAPQIAWLVNGVPNGVTASTFVTSTLDSGDVVSATLLSSDNCAPDSAVSSNTLTLSIFPVVTPVISIVATPAMPIPAGDPVTFNSTVSGVGMSPGYIWLVNGDSVNNGPSFTSDGLISGDVVQAILYTDAPCATVDSALSNAITVMISTGVSGVAQQFLTATPNPSKGIFYLKGQLPGADKEARLSVTNTLGQMVFNETVPVANGQVHTTVSLEALPAGMYILSIQSGATAQHLRVVVEK